MRPSSSSPSLSSFSYSNVVVVVAGGGGAGVATTVGRKMNTFSSLYVIAKSGDSDVNFSHQRAGFPLTIFQYKVTDLGTVLSA